MVRDVFEMRRCPIKMIIKLELANIRMRNERDAHRSPEIRNGGASIDRGKGSSA